MSKKSVEGHKIFVVKKGKSYSPMATQFAWMNKETDVKELCRLFSVMRSTRKT